MTVSPLPRNRRRAPRRPAGYIRMASLVLLAIAPLATGCFKVAAAWANITHGDWIEPQFTLTKAPLLILIDDRNSLVTEPIAMRELHKTISENFLAFKVNEMVVPFDEWRRLAQNDRSYHKYSIRQIGEKLGAEQVLYINVERFTIHSEVGAPIFKGEFTVRVKVLSTDRKKDIRLWPSEEAGKRMSSNTPATSADSEISANKVATELAVKLGKDISKMFYGHRELEE